LNLIEPKQLTSGPIIRLARMCQQSGAENAVRR
jgi:hypothetical protein